MLVRSTLFLLSAFLGPFVVGQSLDVAVSESRVPHYAYPGRPVTIIGDITSHGITSVTSLQLNYTIDDGPVQSMAITGLSLTQNSLYEFFHDAVWTPDTPGLYEVIVWVAAPNGQDDMVPENDAATSIVRVLDPIPMIIDQYLSGEPVVEMIADQGQDLLVPRDLAFHPDPDRDELWVVNKDVNTTGGSTVRFFGAGEEGMTWLWQRDPNAWHFMSLPTAIAFGDNNNFATSPGIFNANQSGEVPFTGPSLWDSDPQVYAQAGFGPLGSHIDMLHVNPRCQGIAHDTWNRYWVVDGHNGDITMNDFRKDHGPGNSWHGDAIIRRYSEFTISRDMDDHIVSHNVLDKNTGWLYVVDHGGQRIMRLDINSGVVSGPGNFGPWESYEEYSMVSGYTWEEIISDGLVQPSGIEVIGERLLVSDHATGEIVIYDLSSPQFTELGRIATGAPGIMGITVGPDGRIWYVNATLHQLGRVTPDETVGIQEQAPASTFLVHPNPAEAFVVVPVSEGLDPMDMVEIRDLAGRVLRIVQVAELHRGLDISHLPNGTYMLTMPEDRAGRSARFVVSR